MKTEMPGRNVRTGQLQRHLNTAYTNTGDAAEGGPRACSVMNSDIWSPFGQIGFAEETKAAGNTFRTYGKSLRPRISDSVVELTIKAWAPGLLEQVPALARWESPQAGIHRHGQP